MEHLPPAPSPSQEPWRGFSSAAIGVGVLWQAVNKAASDKANAPSKNWPFVAFFIRWGIWPVCAAAWTQAQTRRKGRVDCNRDALAELDASALDHCVFIFGALQGSVEC